MDIEFTRRFLNFSDVQSTWDTNYQLLWVIATLTEHLFIMRNIKQLLCALLVSAVRVTMKEALCTFENTHWAIWERWKCRPRAVFAHGLMDKCGNDYSGQSASCTRLTRVDREHPRASLATLPHTVLWAHFLREAVRSICPAIFFFFSIFVPETHTT